MRIAVMGSGGVGSYFGARLAASGEDVNFISRGAHLKALKQNGMTVRSPHGDLVLEQIMATEDPAEVGVVDVIVLAVKLYDLDEACQIMEPMIGPKTMIVPIQNGVSATDMVASWFGNDYVVGGLVFVASFIVAPGMIEHKTKLHRLVCGEIDCSMTERVLAFCKTGEKAGFEAVASKNIKLEIWQKFANLAGISPVTSLSRQTIGVIESDSDLKHICRQSISEVVAVGTASGGNFPEDIIDTTLALNAKFDPNTKNSMLLDLEAGKPLEHEWISGEVVRLGRKLGISTPFHEIAYAMLKPYVNGTNR